MARCGVRRAAAIPSGGRRQQRLRRKCLFPTGIERRTCAFDAPLACGRRRDGAGQAADLQPAANRAHETTDARHLPRGRGAAALERRVRRRDRLVEAPVKRLLRSGAAAAAAGVMIAVVGMLAVTGRWPGSSSIQRFAPAGILDLPAERVARIDIIDPGGGALTFDRKGTGWVVDGTAA